MPPIIPAVLLEGATFWGASGEGGCHKGGFLQRYFIHEGKGVFMHEGKGINPVPWPSS